MFWPRYVATTAEILYNARKFKLWTFRGYRISSKTGYRRGVVLPLNVPSRKQRWGKTCWKCGFAFEQSRYKLDVWDGQKMGNRRRFVEAKYFRRWRQNTQRGKKTKTPPRQLLLCWADNEQRQKIWFPRRFSFYFSLQLEMRQEPESQAAVMNVPHCSPLKSRWSAERWASSKQTNVGLWQQTKVHLVFFFPQF